MTYSRLYPILAALFLFISCQKTKFDQSIHVSVKDGIVEIDNGIIKARFTQQNSSVKQEYYSYKDGKWILVVESFLAPQPFPIDGIQLFDSKINPGHRFLFPENLNDIKIVNKTKNSVTVKLSGQSGNTPIEQLITLDKNQEYFHVEASAELTGQPARLDYLLSSFTFNLDKPPSFVHTPGLKYDNEDSGQDI